MPLILSSSTSPSLSVTDTERSLNRIGTRALLRASGTCARAARRALLRAGGTRYAAGSHARERCGQPCVRARREGARAVRRGGRAPKAQGRRLGARVSI